MKQCLLCNTGQKYLKECCRTYSQMEFFNMHWFICRTGFYDENMFFQYFFSVFSISHVMRMYQKKSSSKRSSIKKIWRREFFSNLINFFFQVSMIGLITCSKNNTSFLWTHTTQVPGHSVSKLPVHIDWSFL